MGPDSWEPERGDDEPWSLRGARVKAQTNGHRPPPGRWVAPSRGSGRPGSLSLDSAAPAESGAGEKPFRSAARTWGNETKVVVIERRRAK